MGLTIEELSSLPIGTVLQKGKRKRIYRGMSGMYVLYSTPSKPKEVTGIWISDFKKWLESAEVVSQ